MITREAHKDLERDEMMNLDRSFDFQRRKNLTLFSSDVKLKRS